MSNLKGKLRCVGLSDTGKVREHNEDTIAIDADIGLLVLADGMGGYNAGEVASGIAVKTIVNLVREAVIREDLEGQDAESGLARPSIILRDAIYRANKIIHQTSKTQPQCEGMGTTVVCCLFYDNKVSIAHVGDSRLYRLRNDRFEQVTMDHSLLQELVDRGFYSQQEAQRATNKNYVTRALGVDGPSTLASRHALAYFLGQSGQRAEAVAMLREVVAARTRLLGAEHPDTKLSRDRLGLFGGS